MVRHLLFYDGQCGLCDRTVQLLLRIDKHQRFAFAPLQGATAQTHLKNLPPHLRQVDSLILIENFQESDSRLFMMSRGVWRICWLLGGPWILLGWMSSLPSWLFDWAYRIVARNRHRLFAQTECVLPDRAHKDRFLP